MKKVMALLAGAVVLLTALSTWATPVLTLRLSEEGYAPQEYSPSNGLLSLALMSYGTFSINFVGGHISALHISALHILAGSGSPGPAFCNRLTAAASSFPYGCP
jgi:hypothetical protein